MSGSPTTNRTLIRRIARQAKMAACLSYIGPGSGLFNLDADYSLKIKGWRDMFCRASLMMPTSRQTAGRPA
ncbi:MAG: hypothetical protein ACN6N0_10560 [Microvirgula sp.]